MRTQQSRRVHTLSSGFTLLMCSLLLFLSSCAPLSGSTSSATSNPTSTVPVTSSPGIPKADGKGVQTEAISRADLEKNQAMLARIQAIMASMSLDQKLGQLLLVEYLGNDYKATGLQYMITQQYVGGYMYQESNHNFEAPYNVANRVYALSQQAMRDAKIPLMIGTDQEGGAVNRLRVFHGYLPSAEQMAATGDPNFVHEQGVQAAQWMRELGINTDLAPVVDVHTVDPPILQTRMFGSDPQTVATYAGAFLDGLQQNGVAGCLKHFPGLGAITSDPHTGLPTVNRSMTDLENIDLAPYKIMIAKNHPAMIMPTDVLMPAIDPHLPAELSPQAITGILRNQLGYNGVIFTDGLYMLGISETWTISQAAVMAIEAGDDMVEGPFTVSQVAGILTALQQAVAQGKLTIDRIDQSVERILLLKMQYHIIK